MNTRSSAVAACIVIWAATGPLFKFSDTWQLVINTGTTIVTFLMVFLIQRAQNKDALAIHLKLNEIVAACDSLMVARGDLGIECPFEELPVIQRRAVRICLGTPRTRAGLELALSRIAEALSERVSAARVVV